MKDFIGRRMMNWRIRAVLPHLKGRLLDIGCGTNQLVRRYGNGIGIDVYQWGDVDKIVEDSSHLPFEKETFDTVSCIAALNHIPNRQAVLREIFRVLKPGGRVVLTMIPPKTSRVWHFLRSPWDVDQHERGMCEGEVYGFSRKQFMALLNEAGFVKIKLYPFMLKINTVYIGFKSGDNS